MAQLLEQGMVLAVDCARNGLGERAQLFSMLEAPSLVFEPLVFAGDDSSVFDLASDVAKIVGTLFCLASPLGQVGNRSADHRQVVERAPPRGPPLDSPANPVQDHPL